MNEKMEKRTFGVELEFTGISRVTAIRIIAVTISKDINADGEYAGGAYDRYCYKDDKDRVWTIVRDSSITASVENGQCELNTPVLKGSKDIELLQEIIRNLRKYGAKVNSSCGMHIHLGAGDLTAVNMRNLANIWHKNESMFFRAFQVDDNHRNTCFCQPMDEEFSKEINEIKTSELSINELLCRFYHCDRDSLRSNLEYHYNTHRYRALNFHSYGRLNTIEFRLFNATLHAGKVKTAIQFVLALMETAVAKKRTDPTPAQTDNEAYLMHCFINQLKLKGKEYETCRKFLLENLSGDPAWRRGAGETVVNIAC